MYELVASLNEIELETERYTYCDVETAGLYGTIRLIQVYQSHWDSVKIVDMHNGFELIDVWDLLRDAKVVWHSGAYDMTCFQEQLGKFAKFPHWNDTFLAGRLKMPFLEKFSMDKMLAAVLKQDVYQLNGIDKKDMQKSNWGAAHLTDKQYQYAAIDVLYMPKLWAHVVDQVEQFSYTLDKLTIDYMLRYQRKGMPVSPKRLEEAKRNAKEKLEEVHAKLPKGFNSNSYVQVRSLLQCSESDDLALAGMAAGGEERAEYIRLSRKYKKQLSFLDKFTTKEGRIYGHFNVATRSGRSNCSDQNLQQLPSSLKHIFETKKFLVYADFSNLELRTFAAFVNEPTMVQKFREDADLHRFVASRIFNIPEEEVTKRQRSIAKIWNFSSLYGAGVATRISILLKLTGIIISEQEGRRLAKAWNVVFPGVKPWQEANATRWRAGLPGYTALGRPYIAKLFTDQNNIAIQGSGSEVAKLAHHYFDSQEDVTIDELCNFVHDSFTFELDTLEEAVKYAKALAPAMNEAWKEESKNFAVKDLPMPVKVVVAHNWYDCQEEENVLYSYDILTDGTHKEQYAS